MDPKLIVLGAGGNFLGIVDAVDEANAAGLRQQYRIVGIFDDVSKNRSRQIQGYLYSAPSTW